MAIFNAKDIPLPSPPQPLPPAPPPPGSCNFAAVNSEWNTDIRQALIDFIWSCYNGKLIDDIDNKRIYYDYFFKDIIAQDGSLTSATSNPWEYYNPLPGSSGIVPPVILNYPPQVPIQPGIAAEAIGMFVLYYFRKRLLKFSTDLAPTSITSISGITEPPISNRLRLAIEDSPIGLYKGASPGGLIPFSSFSGFDEVTYMKAWSDIINPDYLTNTGIGSNYPSGSFDHPIYYVSSNSLPTWFDHSLKTKLMGYMRVGNVINPSSPSNNFPPTANVTLRMFNYAPGTSALNATPLNYRFLLEQMMQDIMERMNEVKTFELTRLTNCLIEELFKWPSLAINNPNIWSRSDVHCEMIATGDGGNTQGLFDRAQEGLFLFNYSFENNVTINPGTANQFMANAWIKHETEIALTLPTINPSVANPKSILHLNVFGIDPNPNSLGSPSYNVILDSINLRIIFDDGTPNRKECILSARDQKMFGYPADGSSSAPLPGTNVIVNCSPAYSGITTDYIYSFYFNTVTPGNLLATYNTLTHDFIITRLLVNNLNFKIIMKSKKDPTTTLPDDVAKFEDANMIICYLPEPFSVISATAQFIFDSDKFEVPALGKTKYYPAPADPDGSGVSPADKITYNNLITNFDNALKAIIELIRDSPIPPDPKVTLIGNYIGKKKSASAIMPNQPVIERDFDYYPWGITIKGETGTNDPTNFDPLKYSFAKVEVLPNDVNIIIETYVSPLWSRLDNDFDNAISTAHGNPVNKPNKVDLAKWTPLSGTGGHLTNAGGFLLYNTVLSGLRSFGILVTIAYRLRYLASQPYYSGSNPYGSDVFLKVKTWADSMLANAKADILYVTVDKFGNTLNDATGAVMSKLKYDDFNSFLWYASEADYDNYTSGLIDQLK